MNRNTYIISPNDDGTFDITGAFSARLARCPGPRGVLPADMPRAVRELRAQGIEVEAFGRTLKAQLLLIGVAL